MIGVDILGARGLPITLGLLCLALAIASVVGRGKSLNPWSRCRGY
jgi:hypothetical protein